MFILPTLIIGFCYAVVIYVLWLSTKELAKMTQSDWWDPPHARTPPSQQNCFTETQTLQDLNDSQVAERPDSLKLHFTTTAVLFHWLNVIKFGVVERTERHVLRQVGTSEMLPEQKLPGPVYISNIRELSGAWNPPGKGIAHRNLLCFFVMHPLLNGITDLCGQRTAVLEIVVPLALLWSLLCCFPTSLSKTCSSPCYRKESSTHKKTIWLRFFVAW